MKFMALSALALVLSAFTLVPYAAAEIGLPTTECTQPNYVDRLMCILNADEVVQFVLDVYADAYYLVFSIGGDVIGTAFVIAGEVIELATDAVDTVIAYCNAHFGLCNFAIIACDICDDLVARPTA